MRTVDAPASAVRAAALVFLGLTLLLTLGLTPRLAQAEPTDLGEACQREAVACREACLKKCALLDFICRAKCAEGACRENFESCLRDERGLRKSAPAPRPRPDIQDTTPDTPPSSGEPFDTEAAEPVEKEQPKTLDDQGIAAPETPPQEPVLEQAPAPAIVEDPTETLRRAPAAEALTAPEGAPAAAPRSRSIAPAAPATTPPPAVGETESAPPGSSPSRGARVLSLDAAEAPAGPKLNGRILFMTPDDDEPEADYHGYLLLGADLSEARRVAVAEAIACRLKALPTAAAAAAVERLGLFSLPASRAAGASQVTAQDVLEAYDFARAARWLRAAGQATGQTFQADSAIVFVGSRFARAVQMDGVTLPSSRDGLDPVVADASALSATFAAAWVGQIVDGMETGKVNSRQELQSLMEATSWLDWASQPLLSLFRVGPRSGQTAPEACPA